jgi:hypothetical protein
MVNLDGEKGGVRNREGHEIAAEGQDTDDVSILQQNQIGEVARHAAMDPEVIALLGKQREYQGRDAIAGISGISVTSDWQGKHASHPTADFFFSRELSDGKLLILVGDRAGEGVTISYDSDSGSLNVDSSRGEFICKLHERLRKVDDWNTISGPDDAMRLIDSIVSERPDPKGENLLNGGYMVLAAVVIDPSKGSVDACVHGTPPVYIMKPDGQIDVIKGSGMAIGMLPLEEVEVDSVSNLAPGSEIIMMTDGVTDLPLEETAASGLTLRAIDVLQPEDSQGVGQVSDSEVAGEQARRDLFSSDGSRKTSLIHLVEQAKDNAVDDWGAVRAKID